MTETCLLAVSHLTKTFGSLPALDDVSFGVAAGAIHAILGEDGAGKTTFMRVLSGTHPAGSYAGEILLDGQALRLKSPADAIRQGIGVVPRRLVLFEQLSVGENVMLARWHTDRRLLVSLQGTNREAQALFDQWGMDLDVRSPVHALVPGQKRTVMLARALAGSPRLVALDEPLNGIASPQEVSSLLYAVRRLAEHGVTCLYLARRPSEALQIADRVTVLRDGAVAGEWDRTAFDEVAITQATISRRPGDVRHIDEDETSSGGAFGSLQNIFGRLFRPGP